MVGDKLTVLEEYDGFVYANIEGRNFLGKEKSTLDFFIILYGHGKGC